MRSQHLFIVLPLPIHYDRGEWLIEPQAANGLRLWLAHFGSITLAAPLSPNPPPVGARPITAIGGERIEVLALPLAYTPAPFIRALPRVKRQLGREIDRARYLHFAIGGLWGDWGSVAALIAHRRRRPFAVWTDRVESNVASFAANSMRGPRRAYRKLTAAAMRRFERFVIRRAELGLFHGNGCYSAYGPYSRAPHLVHNIHLSPQAQIDPKELGDKLHRPPATALDIVYAGRVHAEKGVFDWIDTVERLAAADVAFNAEWIGDGPLLDQARREVARRGLGGRVRFPGPTTDHKALMARLRAADLFLFCHKTIESPRCLIEGLVSGTPIVGYMTDYARDLIRVHGGGVLVPRDDKDALVTELVALADNRETVALLQEKAAADGRPFSDEAVFAHRSRLMKTLSASSARPSGTLWQLARQAPHFPV